MRLSASDDDGSNMSRKEEYHIQKQVVEWLKLEHPNVMFRSDLGGLKLPIGQATKAKQLQMDEKGWPDLFIAEPRYIWHGLFIEIKVKRSDLYTKKGELRSTKHIIDQAATLNKLLDKGYCAVFSAGYKETIDIIESYLKIKVKK